jgi:hypothetical protein
MTRVIKLDPKLAQFVAEFIDATADDAKRSGDTAEAEALLLIAQAIDECRKLDEGSTVTLTITS